MSGSGNGTIRRAEVIWNLYRNRHRRVRDIRRTEKIALTFDDGPHPKYTEQLLDGLKERGVVATFFVTGENAENYPDIIRREQDEGHLIGNHTYSHIQLTSRNRETFREELVQTNEIPRRNHRGENKLCPAALRQLGQKL